MEIILICAMDINGRWELADYAALKAALGTGAREVQYGDQRVAYQNPREMRETLAVMAAELGLTKSIVRRKTPGFSKGLL